MALRISRASAPVPVRTWTLPTGVQVSLLRDGDGKHFPQRSVIAHLVGRLPNGCIFESTEGKGGSPMEMQLQKGAVIPGMDLALQELTLGSIAEIRIPSELAYGKKGIPRIVPADCELIFEVHILEADGIQCAKELCERLAPAAFSANGDDVCHPWWLARVELLAPPLYYLNFCTQTAKGRTPVLLDKARSVARRSSHDLKNFDVGTADEPFIITDVQREWRAHGLWNLQWFKDHLGQKRQLLKWLGPVFTRQECLWEAPVYETTVQEYIDYMQELEKKDPDCEEQNAAQCPRLYLNGWPAFAQLPWLRGYVLPDGARSPADSMQGSIEDLNSLLIRESEALRESLLEGLTARGSYQPPDKEEQTQKLENEDWDLTKIFMSPKGAITRLHYDNGGAHAWLSQIQGRKMFVCFAPSDGEHLHPFEGDEGLLNGSWLDPMDPDVFEKWPDVKKATPYVAVVEAGETIVAPKGWWHYAVSLDSSVTIMRNFYSTSNQWDMIRRKDSGLASAIGTHVLRKTPKLKNQPDSVINDIATKTVLKLRETFVENRRKLTSESADGYPSGN